MLDEKCRAPIFQTVLSPFSSFSLASTITLYTVNLKLPGQISDRPGETHVTLYVRTYASGNTVRSSNPARPFWVNLITIYQIAVWKNKLYMLVYSCTEKLKDNPFSRENVKVITIITSTRPACTALMQTNCSLTCTRICIS